MVRKGRSRSARPRTTKRIRFGDGSGPPLGVKTRRPRGGAEAAGESRLVARRTLHGGPARSSPGASFTICSNSARETSPKSRVCHGSGVAASPRRVSRPPSAKRPPARKANIAQHYDLDPRLYNLFLDSDRQYSCAYFEYPGQSLDDAQKAKKRHIAAKLLLNDGASVLDIGCGFGGMALYLAGVAGARVTGVTLSQEQFGGSPSRARQSGFGDRVEFRLQDYRDVERNVRPHRLGRHVRACRSRELRRIFSDVSRLLKDDGVMLLHAIGRNSVPGATNPWISKYIFPGGYIPSLSEVLPSIERAGLLCDGHRDPAPALCRDAARLARALHGEPARRGPASMTSGSAACGNSIWRDRNPRSGSTGTWSFRYSSPNGRTRFR